MSSQLSTKPEKIKESVVFIWVTETYVRVHLTFLLDHAVLVDKNYDSLNLKISVLAHNPLCRPRHTQVYPDLNPGPVMYKLYDFAQITYYQASVSLSVK